MVKDILSTQFKVYKDSTNKNAKRLSSKKKTKMGKRYTGLKSYSFINKL